MNSDIVHALITHYGYRYAQLQIIQPLRLDLSTLIKFWVSQMENYPCESNQDQVQTQVHILYIKQMVFHLKTAQILMLTVITLALTIFCLKNTENAPSNEIMNKRMKQVKILLLNSSLVKPNLHLKNLVSQILRRKRRKEECTRLKSLTSSSRALSLNIILFQTSCTTRSWSFASILDATSLSTRPGTLGIMPWDMKASSHTHDTYEAKVSHKRATRKSTWKFTGIVKESNQWVQSCIS